MWKAKVLFFIIFVVGTRCAVINLKGRDKIKLRSATSLTVKSTVRGSQPPETDSELQSEVSERSTIDQDGIVFAVSVEWITLNETTTTSNVAIEVDEQTTALDRQTTKTWDVEDQNTGKGDHTRATIATVSVVMLVIGISVGCIVIYNSRFGTPSCKKR